MEVIHWITEHPFDLIERGGIIGSLLLASYTTWKDERARRISNSIAITEQHREIWKEVYQHPALKRVLQREVDLKTESTSLEEEIFVTSLILHCATTYRAMRYGEFVKLDGLRRDVRKFFTLPIPEAVWTKIGPLQDEDFVGFVKGCVN